MPDSAAPKAIAADDLYPAVLALLEQTAAPASGPVLDIPAGQGAFAQQLLQRGYGSIDCVDINADAFVLRDRRVRFTRHDAIRPLPFPDAHFDQVFSIEGIEHFDSPWTFLQELTRVLKPGGWMFVSTPNTFSVDARLKYLVSGYFPRFRPLMLDPDRVMQQDVDDAHVSPIYFWQLNYYLRRSGVMLQRVSTNSVQKKRQWSKRLVEAAVAGIIRRNIAKRRFPDMGVTSDAVLYGDCLILAARKNA
jgi:ubiquinone/menaquinone biosynthesis C-methylase UbiE